MDATDPYSAVRLALDKFPTEENAKNSMEQRDIEAQRIHEVIENIVGQLNSLKPSYNEQMNSNAAEKESLLVTLSALERVKGRNVADTERRRSYLKEKEIELEDLQQLSEIRRDIINEQKKLFQLLKLSEAENKESWIGDIVIDH